MRNRDGFTLIELLIAVVIIGILVAVVIPNFLNVKTKGFDSAAKSDLRNMIAAEENYFSDNQAYTNISIAAGAGGDLDGDGNEDFRASQGVSLGVTGYADGFQITSKHLSSPNTWCVNTSATQASGAAGSITKTTSC